MAVIVAGRRVRAGSPVGIGVGSHVEAAPEGHLLRKSTGASSHQACRMSSRFMPLWKTRSCSTASMSPHAQHPPRRRGQEDVRVRRLRDRLERRRRHWREFTVTDGIIVVAEEKAGLGDCRGQPSQSPTEILGYGSVKDEFPVAMVSNHRTPTGGIKFVLRQPLCTIVVPHRTVGRKSFATRRHSSPETPQ